MQKNRTPHTWLHQNRHSSTMHRDSTPHTWSGILCSGILLFTHECTEIITPQVNEPESYPSHMNVPNHSSSECTGNLSLTLECTEIIIPRVNVLESYPSHMNAPKSSSLRNMHWNPTPHAWMHQNCDSSSKCTEILPLTHKCTEILSLTHKCTEIVIPEVDALESYPSHLNARKWSTLR